MKTLLLDSSALIAAFDPGDGQHAAAGRLLIDSEDSLATLDFARYEVANASLRGWRSPAWTSRLLGAIEQISEDGGLVASSAALLTRAAELAREHELSIYDAAYVAATLDRGRTLVSCDVRDLVSKGLAVLPSDVAAG
jgi:predicted nucleic acid-binding protein